MTPEEAAAAVTLLRAPAALGAAAFLAGALAGEAVMWTGRPAGTRWPAALSLLAVGVVCAPFLLPSQWYRPRRAGMQGWISAAALAASLRGVYLCASFYPIQSVASRATTVIVEAAIAGILWLSVFAVKWDASRRGTQTMS